jgi:small subunit ribosomal protein S1
MKTFGAFIELFPGVDGLVHISKLGTDRRHQHPKEVLNVGDIVTVRVLDIDAGSRKISLTMEKEDGDYSKDLARLKKEQDKASKSKPGPMSDLVEQAIKKDEE